MDAESDNVENKDGSRGEQIVLISKTGGCHQVDRNMLLRASGYYQSLVNSGMKDVHYRELTLACLTNESLIEVRDYLSGLSTNVFESLKSLNEIEAGLDGAFYLQINDMIDSYIELLLKNLNKSACIRILDIASKYVLNNQVVEKVIKFMLKYFKEIPESCKISLSPDEMLYLVASEEMNADSEMDIFNLIIRWVSEDPSRKCFAEKLLTEVRYSLMTTSDKQKCTDTILDLNLNISYDTDKDSNISRTVGILFTLGSTKIKGQKKSFVDILPVYDFVEACKFSRDNSGPSPVKFNPSRRSRPPCNVTRKACVVDNCLYLFEKWTNDGSFSGRVFMYNPIAAVWSKVYYF
ncbi:hypothetical protein HELRODRAFT_176482 [Helobdella robusta]|uniref:BACK domain-containing protein n=1 Tax=Helobdella robusta TaxID=6412 RepID=T1FAK3_HELRO|nr:hypothetical protein HELRODRAFT_176482 [Helobdella robusta]ESN99722.1 hypothetical protein HELRODRAFT_176482 [Helobdella robusta]